MDYAQEIQRIIDALKEDKTAHPKWRNKINARLEELQPWCLMLYEAPSYSDPMPAGPLDPPAPDLSAIPPSLRQFANPNQIQAGATVVPPQEPET